ncbi:hypothetical protein [Neptunicella sp. SCSIO 80796]|uniref:HzsA-related protein n=1 Tax=Neptunicella plasticusilytica TaxID=3117012 RepID=UPI003A4D689F
MYQKILSLLLMTLGLSACGGEQLTDNNQSADPVVVDIPLAFIKRNLPVDQNGILIEQDLRQPNQFIPGAALYIKQRASSSAAEINITDRAFTQQGEGAAQQQPPLYDVKDLQASYDGSRLLFAMRAPQIEDADDDEQPSWNIWQYDISTDALTRIIASDIVAEAGQDVAPAYLPDGRIVFSSTRQQDNQAILLDEGKPQYQAVEESRRETASVLHVMNADGSDIQQISFNQSHDLDPVVLSNGKILFSRWDQMGGNKGIHFYQVNPDGSQLEILYGRHSHEQPPRPQTVHFVKAKQLPDGRILTAMRGFDNDKLGGDYNAIDVQNFTDRDQLAANGNGSVAQQSILFDNVTVDGSISPGGQFASVSPLWDGSQRMLFSWSQCRVYDPDQQVSEGEARIILPCNDELLADETIQPAPLLYGLWMYDPQQNTQLALTVSEEGIAYTEVVAMEQRPYPADAAQGEHFDATLAEQDLAIIHIRSVYDLGGQDSSPTGIANLADPLQFTPSQRPARFLRVIKAVSIPDQDTREFSGSAFGVNASQLMREIIGYVPIEPDGSAKFEVPARVPLALSIVDQNGRRIGERHQNWLQAMPGEVKTCRGCHSRDSEQPHGRLDAEADSINSGAQSTGMPFPNTNPALFADMGETMAEVASRIKGINYPSADIRFSDIWTDPGLQDVSPGFEYAYADLNSATPISNACATQWNNLCRIVINYPQHIQPLFMLDRPVLADDGVTELDNHRCVNCHSPSDAAEQLQIPAAQLDLRDVPSNDDAALLMSYGELLATDNEQEIIDGALIDRLIPVVDNNGNPVFETDEEGELIVDAEGNPVPVMTTVQVAASMSSTGANSSRFFSRFDAGGSHAGWLTTAELKLLAEWLDIGAQYYNNPFDAPQD